MTFPPAQQTEIVQKFIEANCALESAQIQRMLRLFTTYQQLLIDGNSKINLISQNDFSIFWVRHILDSIFPIFLYKSIFLEIGDKKVMDIGSGAGLPGIPLAIFNPDLQLTSLEATQKKCEFLATLKGPLELNQHLVLCERAESAGQEENHREKYHLTLSRAMANPATVLECCLPFLSVGGHALFWGSPQDWADRAKFEGVAHILGGAWAGSSNYDLPTDKERNGRQIVCIKKISPTPAQYPRRIGVPLKRPLSGA